MSRKKKENLADNDFAKRFEEVCGTSQPAEIGRKLEISYQAAKNYLKGNYPETSVLLNIADKTSFSIHWLLTGEGEKHLSDEANYSFVENKLLLESLIRKIFLEEIAKIFNPQDEEILNNQNSEISAVSEIDESVPITFKLKKQKIKDEKILLEKKNTNKKIDE